MTGRIVVQIGRQRRRSKSGVRKEGQRRGMLNMMGLRRRWRYGHSRDGLVNFLTDLCHSFSLIFRKSLTTRLFHVVRWHFAVVGTWRGYGRALNTEKNSVGVFTLTLRSVCWCVRSSVIEWRKNNKHREYTILRKSFLQRLRSFSRHSLAKLVMKLTTSIIFGVRSMTSAFPNNLIADPFALGRFPRDNESAISFFSPSILAKKNDCSLVSRIETSKETIFVIAVFGSRCVVAAITATSLSFCKIILSLLSCSRFYERSSISIRSDANS